MQDLAGLGDRQDAREAHVVAGARPASVVDDRAEVTAVVVEVERRQAVDAARPRVGEQPHRRHVTADLEHEMGAAVEPPRPDEPREARALQQRLRATFEPRPLAIRALAAWRYLDGPWEKIREWPFRG